MNRPRTARAGLLAAALGLVALAVGAAGAPEPEGADGTAAPAFGAPVPGELIVRFRPGTTAAERGAAVRAEDARVVEGLGAPGLNLLRVAPGAVGDALQGLEASDEVLWAEPNLTGRYEAVPNDPLFARQWGLDNTGQPILDSSGINGREFPGTAGADISAREAWDTTTGGDVIVAITDSGVAYDHPDLAPNIWLNPGESGAGREANGVDDDGNGLVDDVRGWDFDQNDNDPRDVIGHGTQVAGIVGGRGNDGQGLTGVNWRVRLMPLTTGGDQPNTAAIASAFAYAARNGAKVVNASFTIPPSQAITAAIAAAPNVLFVAAAGNQGADVEASSSFFPCNVPAENLICVASTDQRDQLAETSNRGARSVDLAAPGVTVWTTAVSRNQPVLETFGPTNPLDWRTNGAWARSQLADGSTVVSDSPGRQYANNSDTAYATNVGFSTQGQFGCRLKTTVALDIPPPDVLAVEAAAEGAPFARLAEVSGASNGFQELSTALRGLDNAPSVFLRYRLISDGAVTGDGAALKFVIVECVSSTYRPDTYTPASGTSFASPMTAGVAALAWAAAPAATVAQVRAAILTGVDPLPGLAGVTVTGGRLNAAKAVANALATVTPAAAAGPQRAPRVRVLGARVRVSRTGRASVRLRCPAAVRRGCRGTLTLRALAPLGRASRAGARRPVLGRARFAVAPGRAGAARVRLSPAARRVVRARALRAQAIVVTRGADGRRTTFRVRVRLVAVRR